MKLFLKEQDIKKDNKNKSYLDINIISYLKFHIIARIIFFLLRTLLGIALGIGGIY